MPEVKTIIGFQAQTGPQTLLFQCPIQDILYGGARGGGKSAGALGHFWNHANNYKQHARGVLFRKTYPELEDIMGKAREMYGLVAEWNDGKKLMTFNNGATLRFRFLEHDKDADKYQGHEYSWICFEEVGNFPSPIPVDKINACLRSAAPGIVKTFLLTANPGGPGHSWIKSRYIDPALPLTPHKVTQEIEFEGKTKKIEWDRIFIPANVYDNKILLQNDPNYIVNIVKAAGGQEWLLKAWLEGDWNIVAGGMFDDLWRPKKHIIKPFQVPKQWPVYRSFDWGSSKPFSVGWWAIADGGFCEVGGVMRTFAKGTLLRIGEWYGWNGTPNIGLRMLESDFIRKLKEREFLLKQKYGIREIFNGPADSAIFTVQDGLSIADKHEIRGIAWHCAKKGPGSRVHAWQEVRQLLSNALEDPMEDRGLFVTEDCTQFIRTVPPLQRDQKNLDDINTESEDHIIDEVGYMARFHSGTVRQVSLAGF